VDYDILKHTYAIYDKNLGLRSNNINSIRAFSDKLILANDKGIDVFSLKTNYCFPLLHDDLEQNYEANLNIIDEYEDDITLGNHVYYFNGQNLIENNQPKIHFQNIKLFNQSIDYQQDSVFSYTQNFFNFEWCGIYYPKPDALHFQYMLEGFDRDWNDTKERNVTYPRLPAGDYTFRVKALLGTYPSEEITYHFVVKKPFWLTWWFLVFILTTLLSIIYIFIKTRENRLNKKAELEQDKILAQYEAIKSQINPHFLFNTFNTLIDTIEENPKNAVKYVETLSDYFRVILEYRDQKTIAISAELKLVEDFIYILQQRFGENIQFSIDLQGVEGNIAPLTLQMLVENAVKHNIVSKAKPLQMSIAIQDNYIVVTNNLQPKRQPEASTHFGLQSIEKRYVLLSKRPIMIEKNDLYFIVKIPII
jgi:hypothetical protein